MQIINTHPQYLAICINKIILIKIQLKNGGAFLKVVNNLGAFLKGNNSQYLFLKKCVYGARKDF